MKNIIDIYEGVLSKTKSKVSGVKDTVNKVSLKSLDTYKYKTIFDIAVLEDTIYHLDSWGATDKNTITKIINDMNLYNIPVDDNVIDFFYRLLMIYKEHHMIEQWLYYYRDEKTPVTTDADVLKSVFKEGKIYKKYSPAQKEMRQRAVHLWRDIDKSSQYMVFYYDSNAFWIWIPNTLDGENKVFMESLMNLMVKYNK